jgi:hypothetical protein
MKNRATFWIFTAFKFVNTQMFWNILAQQNIYQFQVILLAS